jgi:hypothetical protein
MPPVIASAPDIFTQALQHLGADAQLAALLPGGILPRIGVAPAQQLTPAAAGAFALLRQGPDVALGPAQAHVVTLYIEAHDLPAHGRLTIRRVIERIEWLFDDAQWQPCTASTRHPARSSWQQTVGPLPDDGFTTHKYIGTLRLVAA